MAGAFDLQTSQDWLERLERELQRFRTAPNDRDAAINFFVAAESMLDWKNPGDQNASTRKNIRDSEPLLRVVWDLASLSKHLQVRPQHDSVAASGIFGEFFGDAFFGGQLFGALSVKLKGPAAAQYGSSVSAVKLAERVVAYWKAHA